MKTTLRIICSPLPPRINTVLVLALLCCIAGMTLIAQQAPQPKAHIEPIVRFSGDGSWAAPTIHAVKVGDWFVLLHDAPQKSTDVDAALSSLDFTPANSVLIVKNEPVVAKQADGTWKITFKPNEPKP